jgi:hypothetical protein
VIDWLFASANCNRRKTRFLSCVDWRTKRIMQLWWWVVNVSTNRARHKKNEKTLRTSCATCVRCSQCIIRRSRNCRVSLTRSSHNYNRIEFAISLTKNSTRRYIGSRLGGKSGTNGLRKRKITRWSCSREKICDSIQIWRKSKLKRKVSN